VPRENLIQDEEHRQIEIELLLVLIMFGYVEYVDVVQRYVFLVPNVLSDIILVAVPSSHEDS